MLTKPVPDDLLHLNFTSREGLLRALLVTSSGVCAGKGKGKGVVYKDCSCVATASRQFNTTLSDKWIEEDELGVFSHPPPLSIVSEVSARHAAAGDPVTEAVAGWCEVSCDWSAVVTWPRCSPVIGAGAGLQDQLLLLHRRDGRALHPGQHQQGRQRAGGAALCRGQGQGALLRNTGQPVVQRCLKEFCGHFTICHLLVESAMVVLRIFYFQQFFRKILLTPL